VPHHNSLSHQTGPPATSATSINASPAVEIILVQPASQDTPLTQPTVPVVIHAMSSTASAAMAPINVPSAIPASWSAQQQQDSVLAAQFKIVPPAPQQLSVTLACRDSPSAEMSATPAPSTTAVLALPLEHALSA
jgi:hypothetical protein